MPDELLFVVDENDNPLAPLPRSEVIAKRLWRRTSGAVIVNSAKNRVLCQKRSESKDERPGVWIAMFGGKSTPGEQSEQTILRELEEELGIEVTRAELTFYKKVKSDDRHQFEYLYFVQWNGDESKVNFDVVEVSQIAWKDISEVVDLLDKDSGWYSYGYDVQMLKTIKAQD